MLSNAPRYPDLHLSDIRRLRFIECFGMEGSQRSRSRGLQLRRAAGMGYQQWQRQPPVHEGVDSHLVLSSGGRYSPVRVSGKYRPSPYLAPGGGYGRTVSSTSSLPASNNAFLQSIQSPSNLTPHVASWPPVPYDLPTGNDVLWNNSPGAGYDLPPDLFHDELSFYLGPNALTIQEDRGFCSTLPARSPPSHITPRSISNSSAYAHNPVSHGGFRAAPSHEPYSETQPTHPNHSTDSRPAPAHASPLPPSSTNNPTRQVGLDGRPRLSNSLPDNNTSYMGITSSPDLETIVQAILSRDPMHLSPDGEKAYQEGKSTHTRWMNYEKNRFVQHLCKATTVLPQNIKRLEEGSGVWSDLAESALYNRRPPSAVLSQYEKMETIYFNILTFFRKTSTDSTAAILREIENTIVSAGILGVRNCPVKTAELVAWAAGGMASWFATLHERLSGNPDVSERLRKFQEKTVTPNSGLTGSNLGSSELSGRLFIDGNSAVSSNPPPPPREPNPNTFSVFSDEHLYEIADEIDRAERAMTAEAMREEVAGMRADTRYLLRRAAYLHVLTLKIQAGVIRSIISDDIAERDKKYERCTALLSLPSSAITESTVKAANECIQEYIHTPAPSTLYPTILRHISGARPTPEHPLEHDSLGPAVDELATSPLYDSVAAASTEHCGTPLAETPVDAGA
ncbi:hypothetical protein RhiJN_22961 [Ceratobasidium sp. AG-Ba]|nr:hypothetical protein RhiJN_22961 [Ceratobasidium sp. AG-Ba]